MKAVVTVIAFLLACLAVATLWSIVAALGSPRDIGFTAFMVQTGTIFGLVTTASAVPVLAVYAVATHHNMVSYHLAAMVGFFLGAGLFVVFFSTWFSGSRVLEYIKLISAGGGLGLFGGMTFLFCKFRLGQMVSNRKFAR
ncbi:MULTISPECIES: hypothetical protein [Rhodobacterales]|uniref:Uncharacterized protein n=2 Tax=Rhodobacterales TaxID=204455 RepID=A0A2T1AAL2_TRISK|nr:MULTISPECIES: hypothetical protein [Rhodobacterales]APG49220.1 hypothetical protein PhaeoP97_03870 [Phaeobacter porticola]MDO6758096.1 hypothetical protein [Phaeobacter inhibens]PRZ45622.1 hypothetical protein CLV89_11473 [Tritonibacter scottomollicae]WOI35421.1 hypothetical protein R1T40_22030 [Tritonibacter scottomollicae]